VQHAQLTRQWASDVVLFPPHPTLSADHREQLQARAIGVVDGTVQRLLVEGDQLCGVELDGGRVIRRAAVFVRPRFVPNNDLLVDLGCAVDDTGWVIADSTGSTSPTWSRSTSSPPSETSTADAGHPQPRAWGLVADPVSSAAHARSRDDRGTDRQLRPHAAAASAARRLVTLGVRG
jgi:hypothetical protein